MILPHYLYRTININTALGRSDNAVKSACPAYILEAINNAVISTCPAYRVY